MNGGFYRFSAPLVFRMTGRDACRYLNARLSNNIRDIPPQGCQAAMLNDRGKIEGCFWVLPRQPEEYLLWCEGGDPAAVGGALCRYVVADRAALVDESSEYELIHVLARAPRFVTDMQAELPPETLCVDRKRVEACGMDLLHRRVLHDQVQQLLERRGARPVSGEEWYVLRFNAMHLSFPEELSADLLLPECELPGSESPGKGCYVGQEVVEKIRARGKAPRTVVRLKLRGGKDLQNGLRVYPEGRDAPRGEILSHRLGGAGGEASAFAVLRSDDSAPGTPVRVDEWQGSVMPPPAGVE